MMNVVWMKAYFWKVKILEISGLIKTLEFFSLRTER